MNQIRNHRQAKGFTQARLAYEAGMSEGYLREWEAGRKKNISARLFNNWRNALHLTPKETCDILNTL